MLLPKILEWIAEIVRPVVKQVETWVIAKTKPVAEHFILGTAADLLRSKSALVAENAFLRQQVILLKRQVTHPKLTPTDRGLLVLLASRVRHWKQSLLIVKPDTLLKWHRQGFKLFWRQKSQGQVRKPRISEDIIALIKQMAVENRRWGTKRVCGELLKLGIQVNKGTLRRYIGRHDENYHSSIQVNHGRPFWQIMRMKSGLVTLCRPTTYSFASFSCFSSLSTILGV